MGTFSTPDVACVRAFIQSEKAMRERVFRNNASKRQAKSAECERALRALARIEAELARLAELDRQPSLFTQPALFEPDPPEPRPAGWQQTWSLLAIEGGGLEP